MNRRALLQLGLGLCAAGVLASGCVSLREIAGFGKASDPSVEIKSAEPRWLLISNPRFGDVASEPEYIWVEEDKVPTTMKSFVFGQSTLLAPPEIVARYGKAGLYNVKLTMRRANRTLAQTTIKITVRPGLGDRTMESPQP